MITHRRQSGGHIPLLERGRGDEGEWTSKAGRRSVQGGAFMKSARLIGFILVAMLIDRR
jgi:hypothetical protein